MPLSSWASAWTVLKSALSNLARQFCSVFNSYTSPSDLYHIFTRVDVVFETLNGKAFSL